MNPLHSWQGWAARDEAVIDRLAGAWDEEGGDAFDFDGIGPGEAAEMLAELLVSLKLSGAINATQCCTIAWYVQKIGCDDEMIVKLAQRPDSQSGRFSSRFDAAVGCKPKDLPQYEVDVGMRLRHMSSRIMKPIPILPAHELLHNEFVMHSTALLDDFSKVKATLPPLYHDHPVVKSAAASETVLPMVLYVDGVNFGRGESCLGFWCQFLFGKRRWPCAVFRKTELCNCGCRGWCTIRPIWAALAWTVKALHKGQYPSARHDKAAWRRSDVENGRPSMADSKMGFKAVCLFLKGDWAEFAHTLGLPAWNSVIAPCPCCFAEPSQLYDASGLSPLGWSILAKMLQSYLDACARCEITQTFSLAEVAQLEELLFFDKGKKGSRGRALKQSMPGKGLERGDRLVPTDSCPDIASIPAVDGVELTFWRPSRETSARNRCPLFDAETGLSPWSLGLDWLHCFSLGVFQVWLCSLIADLLAANAWRCNAGSALADFEMGIARLREELFSWYASEGRAGRMHTQVQKLVPTMLGSPAKPEFNLHGSETNSFLGFAVTVLLPKYGALLGARRKPHEVAGVSLLSMLTAIRENPVSFPVAAQQRFCDDVHRHMWALSALAVDPRPKHHFMIEMAGRFYGDLAVAVIFWEVVLLWVIVNLGMGCPLFF